MREPVHFFQVTLSSSPSLQVASHLIELQFQLSLELIERVLHDFGLEHGTLQAFDQLDFYALLSLGTRRYLEIIAPDPRQSGEPQYRVITKLAQPRLIGWAAHPGDLQSLVARLAQSGVAAAGPTPGSRKRPDGRILQWKTLTLKKNAANLLPFFIEWSADSIHPSEDSTKGCSLVRFEAASPDPKALSKQIALLSLDLPIIKGDNPQLRATIAGPKAQFTLTS